MLPIKNSLAYKLIQTSLSISLLLAFTFNASLAQSGRNKTTPTKPSQPSQPTNPASTSEKREEENNAKNNSPPGIPILVVYYSQIISGAQIFSNIVTKGCLERLKESTLVRPGAGREMNRKEAFDFAKASKDTFVLWFELESDIGDRDNVNNRTPPSVVNFVLYSPETGKTKSSGHVYTRNRVPLTTKIPTTNYPGEFQLRQAGEELADRILDTLSLPKPPRRI
jgi:hypothetical protein